VDEIRLWKWRFTDERRKRRIFPCRLTEANAATLKDPERVEGSLEVRRPLGSTSDFHADVLHAQQLIRAEGAWMPRHTGSEAGASIA
jgi:hypothetical protein